MTLHLYLFIPEPGLQHISIVQAGPPAQATRHRVQLVPQRPHRGPQHVLAPAEAIVEAAAEAIVEAATEAAVEAEPGPESGVQRSVHAAGPA